MKTDIKLIAAVSIAVASIVASASASKPVAAYPGVIGAKSGWKYVAGEEEGKIVYVPFEGYYASKGGRIESPRFALDKKPGENAWYRLSFAAKSETDGFWWVDFFDRDDKNVNDVNSRLYASEDWREYEVMVPDMPDATQAVIAFISKKGAFVRDVKMERVPPGAVAEWCDRRYADLPRLDLSRLEAEWWRLPKTCAALREGRPLKIVFLGDSIMNDAYCGNLTAMIKREFPKCDFTFIPSLRGCTGCWYYRDAANFENYVARHKPDLVVIGGISNTQKAGDYGLVEAEDDVATTVIRCQLIGAEAIVCTPPPSYEFRQGTWKSPFDGVGQLAEAKAPFWFRNGYLRRAAARTGVPFWDVTSAPCDAIARSGKPLLWFKRDICHNDDRGKQLIARTMAAYFAEAKEALGRPVARQLVVGVTDECPTNGAVRVNLDYCDALEKAGHIPLVIPRLSDPQKVRALLAKLDAVILTGGGDDIGGATYDRPIPAGTECPNAARDTLEDLVLEECKRTRKPLLGVCRGMQYLNVRFGGSLYQCLAETFKPVGGKLLDHRPGEWEANVTNSPAHLVNIVPGSRFAKVVGEAPLAVTSHHRQAPCEIGKGFAVTGTAPDGVVEVIESTRYPFVGVQFHPERTVSVTRHPAYDRARMLRIFQHLETLLGK